MFTATCGLEVEDLYYAVLTRQQVLQNRVLPEAIEHGATAIELDTRAEINRLEIVKHNLQAHIGDHDYRFDRIVELFPEG